VCFRTNESPRFNSEVRSADSVAIWTGSPADSRPSQRFKSSGDACARSRCRSDHRASSICARCDQARGFICWSSQIGSAGSMANYRVESCLSRVLRFHRVQSRQSENWWRLDRPYCGGDCCNIPCLVDAATLCAVVPAAMLVITKSVDTPAREF
jgi:hypothetical protein